MSQSKYEVSTKTVETLLSPGSAIFEVPVFQRPYSWRKEEIDQLMDDLFSTPSEDLPYFLGSIVLASKDHEKSGRTTILDGQQRLTTISLLIYAFIQKLKEDGFEDAAEHNTYIFSKKIKGQKELKIQLQEVGDKDKKVYEDILSGKKLYTDEEFKGKKIAEALQSIFKKIEKCTAEFNLTIEDMFQRLLYEVEIVCITASSERVAFRLFETLNDRGLSLSSADLIKNKLFSNCGSESIQEALTIWSRVIECTQDGDIVKFFRNHWIAYYGKIENREVYETYRKHLEKLDKKKSLEFIYELGESAEYFEQIVSPSSKCIWGSEVAEVLDRLLVYRSSQARPFILALAKYCDKYKCDHYMLPGVRICESITVRSSIVGSKNPSSIEGIYLELSRILRDENSWHKILEAKEIKDIVSDHDFHKDFASLTVSSSTSAWREILSQVNAAMSTGETSINKGKQVHIEHILPQKPTMEVLAEAQIPGKNYTDYVYRIGNLTLMLGLLNRKASNNAFSEKRKLYQESDIFMTRQLANFSTWGIQEIDERSKTLAKFAVQAYPHPSDILQESICELKNVPKDTFKTVISSVENVTNEQGITTRELCFKFDINYNSYRQKAMKDGLESAEWLQQKTGWTYFGKTTSRRWIPS